MAIKEVNIISKSYNIEVKNILKNVMNYIIRHHKCLVNNTFLNMCKNITHSQDSKIEHILNYFFAELHFLLAV